MPHLGLLFGWVVMFSVLTGWLMVTAPWSDEPAAAGMSTQQAPLPVGADPAVLERKALAAFKEFARLQSRWDLAFLAYYHPQAAIHLRRLLPDGAAKTIEYRARGWEDLQKHWAPSSGASAEDRADTPAYNGIHTRLEANLVIIEGRRRVESEGHTGPYKAVLVLTPEGEWRIIEEWIESQPYSD